MGIELSGKMSNESTVVDSTAEMFFSPNHSAIVHMGSGLSPGAKPTPAKEHSLMNASAIAYWGDTNTQPQDVIKALEKTPWVDTVLDWKGRALYGQGVMWGKVNGINPDGSEIFEPVKDPKINEFMRRSNFDRSYLVPACRDLYKFYNVFPEIILSNDRSQIVNINCQDASFCRWEKQDANGIVNYCYVNADWGKPNGTVENSKKIPVIDPFWDPAETLRARKGSYNYIYPLSYPTSGKVYYALPHWNSIRTSGLLTWSNAIIKYKQTLMNNQISVKYLIETTLEYWIFKYPKYDSLTPEEKQQIILSERQNFDKYLMGETNAGKSMMTIMLLDPITKAQIPGLRITPIADVMKDGAYIEDSQEASSHLLYALGVDGTLIGNAPGKGMGAGSGSDKRVAFNNYNSLHDIHRDILLEPLYLIRDYNKWDPELEFRFKYPIIMTLDSGKQTQQQTS